MCRRRWRSPLWLTWSSASKVCTPNIFLSILTHSSDNASIIFPSTPRLRVTTALNPSGLLCHALVVGPKNDDSKTSRFKMLLKGPGVPGVKAEPGRGRRHALIGLLEEVERRVGKEMLRLE